MLSDMGYKIVDVDGRGATTRRKESLRRFHSKPSVEVEICLRSEVV